MLVTAKESHGFCPERVINRLRPRLDFARWRYAIVAIVMGSCLFRVFSFALLTPKAIKMPYSLATWELPRSGPRDTSPSTQAKHPWLIQPRIVLQQPLSLARTNQNGQTTGCTASRRFPSTDTNSPDRCHRYRKYSSCDHTCCKAIGHVPAATSCISDIEFLARPGHARTFPLIPDQGCLLSVASLPSYQTKNNPTRNIILWQVDDHCERTAVGVSAVTLASMRCIAIEVMVASVRHRFQM